jgi:hypothetical protein
MFIKKILNICYHVFTRFIFILMLIEIKLRQKRLKHYLGLTKTDKLFF